MILIRIILFCLIALFVYALIRAAKRLSHDESPEQLEQESVVPCSMCSVHVPRSEATQHEDLWFCSSEHRDQWLEQNRGD